jgi:hypothetical protein
MAVVCVPIRPRPQAEQFADNGVLFDLDDIGQADDGWIVREVVAHFEPFTGH